MVEVTTMHEMEHTLVSIHLSAPILKEQRNKAAPIQRLLPVYQIGESCHGAALRRSNYLRKVFRLNRWHLTSSIAISGREVETANSLQSSLSKSWPSTCRKFAMRSNLPHVEEPVHDEEWNWERMRESKELQRMRLEEEKEERKRVEEYRHVASKLKDFPEEDVRKAKRFVASLIKSGEDVEEMIVEAGENGELSSLVLLVIKTRLELAQRNDEKDAIQALDLLYRRIENEIMQREASLEMRFLNELLNLHDGFSHEEWLQRARRCMLDTFVPENAFTILAPAGFDPSKIDLEGIPKQDDVLLRVDFLKEVDKLLAELQAQSEPKMLAGFDAQSVALRLRQEERKRALQYVKDLQRLAATLKW